MSLPRALTPRAFGLSSLRAPATTNRYGAVQMVKLQVHLLNHGGAPRQTSIAPLVSIRNQSTTSSNKEAPNRPRPSFTRYVFTHLRGGVGSLLYAFRPETLRTLYHQNRVHFAFAIAMIGSFVFMIGVTIYVLITYYYAEQFTRYPKPIAQSLRRALYYSNHAPDPKLALKYYQRALQQCDELHLDFFSDEVMGIKFQMAAWSEKIGSYDNAIKILENQLGECKRWVQVMEQAVKDGTAQDSVRPAPEEVGHDEYAPTPETLWGKRTRILAKAVGISAKMGALYADEHVMKPEVAHERLTWSVETALKEVQRRSVDGLKEGEGDWLSPEAMGGALEALAHSFESRSQFHFALVLFFRALALSESPCHSAILMNNLAACYAQLPAQSIPAPDNVLSAIPGGPEPTKQGYLEAAQRWATNAQELATATVGEARTAECDEACAVALCNLGDIASLSGDVAEARRRFGQAQAMSRQIGFPAGVEEAAKRLQQLST